MTDLLIGIVGGNYHNNNTTTNDVVYRARGAELRAYRNSDMRHSKSEDVLGQLSGAPTRTPSPLLHEQKHLGICASEDDLIASTALIDSSSINLIHNNNDDINNFCNYGDKKKIIKNFNGDRIDPEDSIRDIVSDNDLYRYVLFKRHYDKYIALAEKYEESRGVAYYLEERYHEVKAERDRLDDIRKKLEKRLENHETTIRDKDEELFLHLEHSLHLDDEIDKLKNERDNCLKEHERLEREQKSALRQLQLQSTENEIIRKNLERSRQDVVRQATVIRAERDALERENVVLKEKLRIEKVELGAERRRREEDIAVLTHEASTLRHAARHLRAAALHATTCRRRRRCSVCIYAKRTFSEVDDYRNDGKLFKCLQVPLQDIRTWLRPDQLQSASSSSGLRTSSPMDRAISYIDDPSSSSEDEEFVDMPMAEESLSSTNSGVQPTSSRAFSSDSGFSSEIGDRRSRSYETGGSSRKISESCSETNDGQQQNSGTFSRTKWTSSFRRLLGRKYRVKKNTDK